VQTLNEWRKQLEALRKELDNAIVKDHPKEALQISQKIDAVILNFYALKKQ
jgi:hypothetical protein